MLGLGDGQTAAALIDGEARKEQDGTRVRASTGFEGSSHVRV